jgi:hypothetical protein
MMHPVVDLRAESSTRNPENERKDSQMNRDATCFGNPMLRLLGGDGFKGGLGMGESRVMRIVVCRVCMYAMWEISI